MAFSINLRYVDPVLGTEVSRGFSGLTGRPQVFENGLNGKFEASFEYTSGGDTRTEFWPNLDWVRITETP